MWLACDSDPLLIYPMQHRYHSDTTLNVLLTFTQKHSLGILGKLGILGILGIFTLFTLNTQNTL